MTPPELPRTLFHPPAVTSFGRRNLCTSQCGCLGPSDIARDTAQSDTPHHAARSSQTRPGELRRVPQEEAEVQSRSVRADLPALPLCNYLIICGATDYPCSNCVSRGATCVFTGRRGQASTQDSNEAVSLRSENAAIKERLEKLERIVLSGSSVSSDTRRPSVREAVLPSPSVSSPAETEAAKGYREDFLWLEGVGSGENNRLPSLSPTFRIRVAHVSEIVQNTINGFYHEHDIPLPTEEEAAIFVDVHTTRIDPAQHFTHVPTRM